MGQPGPEHDAAPNRAPMWIAVAVVTVMVLGGLGVTGAVMVMSPHGTGGSVMAGSMLDLDSVSAQTAAHYHFASAHRSMYGTVPCFCGCDAMLGHRSLRDCFVRPDGAGWDAHASGCAVCIEESQMVRRMLGRGVPPESIPGVVIDRFG